MYGSLCGGGVPILAQTNDYEGMAAGIQLLERMIRELGDLNTGTINCYLLFTIQSLYQNKSILNVKYFAAILTFIRCDDSTPHTRTSFAGFILEAE